MVNKERIMTIIKDIERISKDFDNMNAKSLEDLKNTEKLYAVSMVLFSMTSRCIDLAEEIVSDKKLGFPEGYKDIFVLLEKAKIIDKSLFNDFSDFMRFRNAAAHEYYRFTSDYIFSVMKKVPSIHKFLHIVKKELK